MIFDVIPSARTNRTPPWASPGHPGERRQSSDRSPGGTPPGLADVCERSSAATREDVLHRCRQYRKAFPWAAITVPASALRLPGVATRVKKGGSGVDVHSGDELAFALSAGIPAARITLHDDGITATPLRCAVQAGVGRFVMGCCQQVPVLASCAQRPQRVLVDVTTDCGDATVAAVFARQRLSLIGLHARLAPATSPIAHAQVVAEMIATMAQIRRERDVILTRVSLAVSNAPQAVAPCDPRALAAELEDTFDDTCARYRFPRPALILAPC